jgi:uridine kinase
MSLVESKLTAENVERARHNPELEKLNETEHKLTPTNPERLVELFKAAAQPIEQVYLSTPHDELSLRVRAHRTPEGINYTSTLKTRGEQVGDALQRSEIETDISAEAYEYFENQGLPKVHKLRTQVMDGVHIDFYENAEEPVVVEVEHKDPEIRAYLLHVMQDMVGHSLVDRSHDPALTNEAIAFKHTEHTKSPESLDVFSERVLAEMIAHYVSGKNQVVVGLTGMSGSGKTTVTQAVQERIVELYGEHMKPIVISTDDYHFGKKKLEEVYGAPYTAWDAPQTYNTAELALDLERFAEGYPLVKRHFSFQTEEPEFEENVFPASPFVIVEGLYAGSKDLKAVRDLHFELPTGMATSVGRDVRRLVIDGRANRAFPTPQSRLRHQIETALPTYLEQQKPERNSYSASIRPMADRAFMLAALRS